MFVWFLQNIHCRFDLHYLACLLAFLDKNLSTKKSMIKLKYKWRELKLKRLVYNPLLLTVYSKYLSITLAVHFGIATMNEFVVFLKRRVMRNCCLTQVCYYVLEFSNCILGFLETKILKKSPCKPYLMVFYVSYLLIL